LKTIVRFIRRVPTSLVSLMSSILDIIAVVPDAVLHFAGVQFDSFFSFSHIFMGVMFAVSAGLLFLKTVVDEERIYKRYLWQLFAKPFLFTSFVLDGMWHTRFGFETDLDVINSITHIMMAVGITTSVSGTIIALWGDVETNRLYNFLKTFIVYACGGLVTLFLGLFFNLLNAMFHLPAVGFTMIHGALLGNEPLMLADTRSIVPTMIFFGVFFTLLKRWKPFPGAGTLYTLISLGLMVLTPIKEYNLPDHLFLLPSVLITCVSMDILLVLLQPGKAAWRTILFAALIPLLWWNSYLYLVSLQLPLVWSAAFITGFASLPAFLNALLGIAILSKPPVLETITE
jgi:hypothetical protein